MEKGTQKECLAFRTGTRTLLAWETGLEFRETTPSTVSSISFVTEGRSKVSKIPTNHFFYQSGLMVAMKILQWKTKWA